MMSIKFTFKHIGSIAYGVIFILLANILRIIFVYPSRIFAGEKALCPLCKCISALSQYWLDKFEEFCDFNSEGALALQAITGEPFRESGEAEFLLQYKWCQHFKFGISLAQVFIILGNFGIAFLNTYIGYEIMLRGTKVLPTAVNNPIPPLICIYLLSYLTSAIFLGLFSTTTTSLMTCYAVDKQLNKGDCKFGP